MLAPMLTAILLGAEALDPIAGGAGWASFGIAGLVLSWLLLKHLPDKAAADKEKDNLLFKVIADAQQDRNAMSVRYDTERATERTARHERMSQFQAMFNSIALIHEKALKELQAQHRAEAEADRAAFLDRNDRLLDAIRTQTVELRMSMANMIRETCQAYQLRMGVAATPATEKP